jgi:(2Fe-2S) ferredoxin
VDVSAPHFKKYLFVCENEKPQGPCCGSKGSAIRELLKKRVAELGESSKIRVSRAGCLDVCAHGPNVLLMPDNLWFKHVDEKDILAILKRALDNGGNGR